VFDRRGRSSPIVCVSSIETDLNAGHVHIPGLVINMNTVFERFVRNALRRALGATEQEFPAPAVAAALALDDARRLQVNPDLSWWTGGSCHFVGELKYRYDSGRGAATNLYQTLAYAVASGLPDATLIYADGPTNGTSHHLSHAAVHLHVRHLDLSLQPTDLLRQIHTLADYINAHPTRPDLHR